MLGRAVKEHALPPPAAPSKQNFTPSQSKNGNIQERFSQARQPSASISGFTNYVNLRSPSNPPLQSKSSNASFTREKSTSLNYPSTASTVSSTSSGLHSVFSRQDSFSTNSDSVVDLTHDALKKNSLAGQHHVMYDENDFDDDAEIDLDMDYALPEHKLMAPPLKVPPKAHVTVPPSAKQAPVEHRESRCPPSSAQTWSSSPPGHKLTPPGGIERRQREQEASHQLLELDSSQPVRAAVPKRRTLPWAQKVRETDEEAQLESIEEDVTSSGKKCLRCREEGHYADDCPSYGKGKSGSVFTPLPKDRKMPWNTTASAVANEKKQFRDRKRRSGDTDLEQATRHHKKVAMAAITLSEEQQRVLDLVVNQQKSVFFTGSAGTGKSVLMRAIIADLRKKYIREPDRVAVTASTGLAACNIGGVTLHSFGGIGLGKEDVGTLVKKIKKNAKAKTRWLKTKILIIDEISMVDGDLFDKLEGIARMMRNNGRPFGGIQLVITGDFFQLPPVPDFDNKSRGAKFAFDAGTWTTAIHHTIGLTEVFRQKDPVFANMLNEMRLGKITEETIKAFKKLSRKIEYTDTLDATELFPTRFEVENANAFRMKNLAGKEYQFTAADTGTITDIGMRDKLLSNMMAPKTLGLKKGAQVMLIKNMDDTLVNGSLGKVVAFMSEKNFEIYHENPDILDESIPSQDLDEQSRTQRSSIKSAGVAGQGGKLFPLVRFAIADGTFRDLLVMPEEWKVELPSGEVQAQRSQLPLILAWALSIHKAQGQTLERVKIDLKKIFEKGQAYVALSRATSQAGLEVQNFDKSKVMAHHRVAEFYNSLYSVNAALKHPKVAVRPKPTATESYEEMFRKNRAVIDLEGEEEEARLAAYA